MYSIYGLSQDRIEKIHYYVIISLEMLSIPEDLPWRRIYAPRSISSLVISASKGPTSVVFWGSVLLSVSFGFCKTFLKCACQFSPEIPAMKFRSLVVLRFQARKEFCGFTVRPKEISRCFHKK